MSAYVVKGAKENFAQMFRFLEESVMRGVFARIVPNAFGGVEFRPVRRQLKNLQIAPVFGKPVVCLLFLVIGSIVLNQINPMAAAVIRRQENLIHEGQVGFPLEVIFLVRSEERRV